jgi:hypothetical protein
MDAAAGNGRPEAAANRFDNAPRNACTTIRTPYERTSFRRHRQAGQSTRRRSTSSHAALRKTMRNQRIQDFLFHKITLLFAASVLLALVGIIVSLAIGAAPAFREFGPASSPPSNGIRSTTSSAP